MNTAKDLAEKAYYDGMKYINPDYCNEYTEVQRKERFENWWQQIFWDKEHKDFFSPEHNVYINGKRYIQAE